MGWGNVRAYLEKQTVTRADGKCSYLRQCIWTGFKNDQEHAYGRGHFLKHQAISKLCTLQYLHIKNSSHIRHRSGVNPLLELLGNSARTAKCTAT